MQNVAMPTHKKILNLVQKNLSQRVMLVADLLWNCTTLYITGSFDWLKHQFPHPSFMEGLCIFHCATDRLTSKKLPYPVNTHANVSRKHFLLQIYTQEKGFKKTEL